MKRVVIELNPLPADAGAVIVREGEPAPVENPDPVSVFSIPAQSVAILTTDRVLVDYLTDGDAPDNAVYVGEMDESTGVVTDLVGDAADVRHIFFGWDRKTLAEAPEGVPVALPAELGQP